MQDLKNTPQDATTTAPEQPAAVTAAPAKEYQYPHTTGEKWFNRAAYGGIGWILNAGISVWVADKGLHTTWAPKIDNAANKIKDSFFFRVGEKKTPQQLEEAKGIMDKLHDAIKAHAVTENKATTQVSSFDAHIPAHAESYKKHSHELLLQFRDDVTKKHQGELALPKIIEKYFPNEKTNAEFAGKLKTTLEDALSKQAAKNKIEVALIMSGGFILMAPIKWLEDSKPKIVSTIDRWLGKDSKSPEEQALINKRQEQIEKEPQQSWSSILASRFASIAPIFAFDSLFAHEHNIITKMGGSFKGTSHHFGQWAKKLNDFIRNPHNPTLHETTNKWVEKFKETNEEIVSKHGEEFILNSETRMQTITRLSYTDVMYSLVSASLVFGFTRVFAPLLGKKESDSPSQDTSNAPTTAPQITAQATGETSAITHHSSAGALTTPQIGPEALEGNAKTAEPFVMHGHAHNAVEHPHELSTPVSKVSAVHHHGASHHEHLAEVQHEGKPHHGEHKPTSKREHEKSVSYSEMAKHSKLANHEASVAN